MQPLSQWMEMVYTPNNRLPEALAQASSEVHRPVDDASQGLFRWRTKMWLGSAGSWVRCREVCCRDLAERSSCRDLAQRSLLESLSRDLVERFLTEILPRDLSRRDLVQISCQETSYRSLVQRSCTDISARGLVKRCFVERFCRDIARPLTEILYRDLV